MTSDERDANGRVRRGIKAYRFHEAKYGGGRPMPRGPLGTHDVGPGPVFALGFCPLCASNARETTGVRGVYDCPTCTLVWYDERVGEQQRSFEDYVSNA